MTCPYIVLLYEAPHVVRRRTELRQFWQAPRRHPRLALDDQTLQLESELDRAIGTPPTTRRRRSRSKSGVRSRGSRRLTRSDSCANSELFPGRRRLGGSPTHDTT